MSVDHEGGIEEVETLSPAELESQHHQELEKLAALTEEIKGQSVEKPTPKLFQAMDKVVDFWENHPNLVEVIMLTGMGAGIMGFTTSLSSIDKLGYLDKEFIINSAAAGGAMFGAIGIAKNVVDRWAEYKQYRAEKNGGNHE